MERCHNIGGFGKSRREQFKGTDTEVLQHPHFLPILKYILCGPDLPLAAAEEFVDAIASCGTVTSGDLKKLSDLAVALTKRHTIPHPEEQFYKLAVEYGVDSDYAKFIRDAVMKRGKRYQ